MNSRRGSIYGKEFRTGAPVRGSASTSGGRFAPVDLTKPYRYGGSQPDTRPVVPAGEHADRPDPATSERMRRVMRRVTLQRTYRPLTTAELVPGLWVEQIIETKSGNFSNPGLLAIDRRLEQHVREGVVEDHRIVLWTPLRGGTARSHFVLGPGYPRDDRFPTHEVWPIDPEYFAPDVRSLLAAFADRAVYNPTRGEFEVTA
ncbi:hypothetical protein [Streptomyces anulatus]|uniref:hypothetical protein n=1 Tax=Streptomyces anulatus TaxID=1892 RepID=UPI0034337711